MHVDAEAPLVACCASNSAESAGECRRMLQRKQFMMRTPPRARLSLRRPLQEPRPLHVRPSGKLESCMLLRGGAGAKVLSPKRSLLGKQLDFIASRFDPAFARQLRRAHRPRARAVRPRRPRRPQRSRPTRIE